MFSRQGPERLMMLAVFGGSEGRRGGCGVSSGLDDPLIISWRFFLRVGIPLRLARLIRLIKSFVHLEISDDNLFHPTLQRSCEKEN